jgi:hypothetical protein
MGRPRIYANPSARTAAWKKRNPKRVAEQNSADVRRWKERHPDRVRASKAAERESYGITVAEIEAMAVAQGGACAICGIVEVRSLCVDHDHETGRVRGLLCHKCNLALGLLCDDAALALRAASYLLGMTAPRVKADFHPAPKPVRAKR